MDPASFPKNWCRFCDASFGSGDDLAHHLRTEHPFSAAVYKTIVTGDTDKTTSSKGPRMSAAPNPEKKAKHQCEFCPKTCKSVYHLAKHVKYKHKGAQQQIPDENTTARFACSICGKTFSSQKYREIHERTVAHKTDVSQTRKRGRPKKVVEIKKEIVMGDGRTFSSLQALARSIKTEPGTTKSMESPLTPPPPPPVQPEEAITIIGETRVTEKNPLKCEICGKVFAFASGLRVHERKHRESFACNICGMKFKKDGNRRRHEMVVHGTMIKTGQEQAEKKAPQVALVQPTMMKETATVQPTKVKETPQDAAIHPSVERSVPTPPPAEKDPQPATTTEEKNGVVMENGEKKSDDKDRKEMACQFCGKSFSHSLSRHVTLNHSGATVPGFTGSATHHLMCNYCGVTGFKCVKGRQVHEQKRHPRERRAFGCSVCKRAFSQKYDLDEHGKTVHRSRKAFGAAAKSQDIVQPEKKKGEKKGSEATTNDDDSISKIKVTQVTSLAPKVDEVACRICKRTF